MQRVAQHFFQILDRARPYSDCVRQLQGAQLTTGVLEERIAERDGTFIADFKVIVEPQVRERAVGAVSELLLYLCTQGRVLSV